MLPKQKEMDDIVRLIYEAMEKETHHENTLLVMAGDHGMNAGGNHGGSGPGETEPALVFASPKLKEMKKRRGYKCPTTPKEGTEFHYYTKVEQSDLIPTLAGLMGFPISRNSLGVMIPELEGLWSEEETGRHLRRNAEQIVQIVEATYGEESFRGTVKGFEKEGPQTRDICEGRAEGEQRLACLWAVANANPTSQSALTDFLLSAQDSLSGTASSYNIPLMALGMALTLVILLLSLLSLPSLLPITSASSFFTLTTLLYGLLMFASSYVEEEQQFWYWLTPAWILILSISSLPSHTTYSNRVKLAAAAMAILAVNRLSVRWNQTGQKHSGAEDVVHTFFPEHYVGMWILILGTYAWNGLYLMRRTFVGLLPAEVEASLAVLLVVPALVFKLNFTHADAPELVGGLGEGIREWTGQWDLVLQARFAFFVIGGATVMVGGLALASSRAAKARKTAAEEKGLEGEETFPSLAERVHGLLTLFLITQSRAPNIPLFLGMEVQRLALSYILSRSSSSRTTQVATTALLLSHVTYFCTGGSNSISSIDLSNAYNGVSDYNIAAVGVLLFASNWTGPVWWCSAAGLLLADKTRPAVEERVSGDAKRKWVEKERQRLKVEAVKAVSAVKSSATGSEDDEPGKEAWTHYLSLTTIFIAVSLLGVMASCTALRTHLFIWTVFSPKYLYAMAWAVGWHLGVNCGLGAVLIWMGKIR
jgi:ethanolaminephosphotransferase